MAGKLCSYGLISAVFKRSSKINAAFKNGISSSSPCCYVRHLRIFSSVLNNEEIGSKKLINSTCEVSKTVPLRDRASVTCEDRKNQRLLFLKELEDAKDKGAYQQAISCFHGFQSENPEWTKHWPAQRIAATILYVYYKAGLYDPLLQLHKSMIDNGLQHGEGIYKTLIKCCLELRNWEQALGYLQIMKGKGLRNIRIYSDLIKSFAENNQLQIAFELFKEMSTMELNQKTRKQLNDQAMLILLINASIEHSNLHKTDCLANQIVGSVLSYISERCLPVSHGLSHVIFKWVKLQSDWSVEIKDMDPSENASKLSYNLCEHGEKEILNFVAAITSISQDLRQIQELEELSEFLKENGPFDVIVDGANAILSVERDKITGKTNMRVENLVQLIQTIALKDKRLIIVLPEILNEKSNFRKSEEYRFLVDSDSISIFWTRHVQDDLAVIYAALRSELLRKDSKPNIVIITNDSLRDHIQLAKTEQWKLLKWIRQRQAKFFWDPQHRISIKRNLIRSTDSANTWTLTQEDGKLICISFIENIKSAEAPKKDVCSCIH